MNYEVLQSIIQMQNSGIELQLNHPQIVCSAVALHFLNMCSKEMSRKPYHSMALSKRTNFLLFLFLLIYSKSTEMPPMCRDQSL